MRGFGNPVPDENRPFKSRGQRSRADDELEPRMLSARLRGQKAPYVHTSLSPDRFLRRRARIRRRRPLHDRLQARDADDTISISSDSDVEYHKSRPDGRPCKAACLPTQGQRKAAQQPTAATSGSGTARIEIDLTRDSEEPGNQGESAKLPRPKVNATSSASAATSSRLPIWPGSEHIAEAPTGLNLQRAHSRKYGKLGPPWLRVAIGELWKVFPDLRYELTGPSAGPSGSADWSVACLLCEPRKEFPTGPGEALDTFGLHLRHAHFPLLNRVSQPGCNATGSATLAGAPASPATTSAAAGGEVLDDIQHFLMEQGLSSDIGPILRATGITDRARMRRLGQMSASALDKLEQRLAADGLDFAACLLVREGLSRLAKDGES
ncbi:hypothetical protein OH77DRAFT_1428814 [Trametes cingulata]|nr:hypothetical protein OH77DRAFT_1428814 [Trametes cingulata]